jgi:hypothetical protein
MCAAAAMRIERPEEFGVNSDIGGFVPWDLVVFSPVIFPKAVTQELLIELARGQTRQFGLEVNRAWTFLACQVHSTERHQLLNDFGSRGKIGHKLHDSLDLLSEIVVGTPNTAASATFGCV